MQLTQYFKSYLISALVIPLIVLSGCAVTSTIQPVTSSKSQFDDAFYAGQSEDINSSTLGNEGYRIFHQGATSFVSIQTVRAEAEMRATEFCARKSKMMKYLRETTSKPPHVLGNFPRIEIIFECVDKPSAVASPRPESAPSVSTGTAFVVQNSTTLITAFHVIEGARTIEVTCGAGQQSPALVERIDPANDLALLKLTAPALAHLELAPDNSVVIGQRVFTIGFPVPSLLGTDAKYSDGAISSLSGLFGAANLLQVTVPIQPGNSGGPLVDESGRVVAVITSTAAVQGFLRRTGSLPQNINWAVRSEYVRLLLSGILFQQGNAQGSAVERVRLSTCMVKAIGA